MVIWRISDGKPGHDNQSRGLAGALARRTQGLRCIDIPAKSLRFGLWHYLMGRYPPGADLESPRLIIGAGHKTHLSMLCARRARGGITVVIMKPSLPTGMFDYALIPSHDNPPPSPRTLVTEGAINTLTPSPEHDPARGLILIGGPSRHYDWDAQDIMGQVNAILEQSPGVHWDITDSPRTPRLFSALLERLGARNATRHSWEKTARDWLPERLKNAGQVWVSEDSISMVYEALTAGAATGILRVRTKRPGKIPPNITRLKEHGMITYYDDWLPGTPLPYPGKQLDEADRCAVWLLEKLETGSKRNT